LTPRPLLLAGGLVLRGDAGGMAAAPLDILVEGGRIAALLPPGAPHPEGVALLSAQDRLVIPGLVNAHTHRHGALGRGAVADRVTLEMFLAGAGALNGHRGLDEKRLSARLSAAELIRRGCTACYDLHVEVPLPTPEGLGEVGAAYAEARLRAVVAPMMAGRTLFQAIPGLADRLPPAARRRAEAIAAAPAASTAPSASSPRSGRMCGGGGAAINPCGSC
jgi:cytosine/adenosine deaminase-related metal-dependent hydrolase